jgi:uracil-DNA glycosylase
MALAFCCEQILDTSARVMRLDVMLTELVGRPKEIRAKLSEWLLISWPHPSRANRETKVTVRLA